jgi:hypothetical protein
VATDARCRPLMVLRTEFDWEYKRCIPPKPIRDVDSDQTPLRVSLENPLVNCDPMLPVCLIKRIIPDEIN